MKYHVAERDCAAEPVTLEDTEFMAVAVDGQAHLIPAEIFEIFCRPTQTEEEDPGHSSRDLETPSDGRSHRPTQRAARAKRTKAADAPHPLPDQSAASPSPKSKAWNTSAPPKVKVLPASGTVGAAIMAALGEGKTMTTAELQDALAEEYTGFTVASEVSILRSRGFIGSAGKNGKANLWERI